MDKMKNSRLYIGIVVLVSITTTLVKVLHRPPRPEISNVCPNTWVGFQGKCHCFSNTKSDWNSSREHCERLRASLATIDTREEMEFMLRYQGPANCWIGLHREEGDERWTWADGSAFTNWFQLRGRSQCAYLNRDRISSALCLTKKCWVCSRANKNNLCKNGTYPQ
ncbi:C-type lectin domain family 2 member B-like isoform X2 [Numida meleagris]|uniref:C-type lectin domain family 2 member B-like isoform X2 n=1 Tax=Numida meleagris TaxID=8996 RepID=UPI000B3DE4A6|nr:C-type lectin domain family 2 member B-like isoform X2 [Numida meleagris]